MEGDIHYCTSKDGARIAYTVFGSGPTLVCPPGWTGNNASQWNGAENARAREFFAPLAHHRSIVMYDKWGCGLSDRERAEFTLESELRPLEAVSDAVKLRRCAIWGSSQGRPAAVAYAVKYQRRVSHLLLYDTYARGQDHAPPAFRESFKEMVRSNWGVASRTLADMFVPGASGDELEAFARRQRAACSAEMAANLLTLTYDLDITDLCRRVRVPTVVMHRRGDRAVPFRLGQHLASLIPNARFVPLEGNIHSPALGDTASVQRVAFEFLGLQFAETAAATGESSTATGLPGTAVILFTDIVESTALTERLGDAAFRARARDLDASLRAAVRDCGGTPVEGTLLGDGLLALFTSARQAIDCALRCRPLAETVGLQFHLGLHAGDVIREGNNVYGGAVNLAARIKDASAPGQVLVSATVRDLARTSAGVSFADRGEHALKGIAEPVRLFEVRGLGSP